MSNLKKLAELFSCNINELISSKKDVEEEIVLNTKKSTFYNIVGMILSFICFVGGMIYAEQVPILVIVGIMGLAGTGYFYSRIVVHNKNEVNE